jgi:glycosyltransferase involved in cell wall biosynthesis
MRIGFHLFGGRHWAGGANYLENLLSSIAELPGRPIECVALAEANADPSMAARVERYLAEPPVWIDRGGRARRLARLGTSLALGRDHTASRAFRRAGIDLFFHHMVFYGGRLDVPTLAWIPDFQHRRLPHMFTPFTWWKRELGFRALTRTATRVVVSSQDAKRDCERFYPAGRGRIEVLPFAVRLPPSATAEGPDEIRRRLGLPEKFLFFPGQLWKHKNHLGVVEALRILRGEGKDVVVAASGSFEDYRNPAHAEEVRTKIADYGVEANFRILGTLPYEHAVMLMRIAIGIVNPSFCEGWSTTVEEGKALGAPLLLSDLAVHREQAGETARYFDPADPRTLAAALAKAWEEWRPGPRPEREQEAKARNEARRLEFASRFAEVATGTIAGWKSRRR